MGKKWKQCQILFSWAPKSLWTVTAAMKLRCMLLGRKAMTNLDSIMKSRGITFLTKVHVIKAMAFSVVIHRCKSWTIKKPECWRIVAFELWCWRRLLRVPWMAKRSYQAILNRINPEYSLEGLMLKLKLQYFGHLIEQTHWKRPDARKNWRQEKKGTRENEDSITDSMDMSLNKLWKTVKFRETWHAAVQRVPKSWTWLSNWTAVITS